DAGPNRFWWKAKLGSGESRRRIAAAAAAAARRLDLRSRPPCRPDPDGAAALAGGDAAAGNHRRHALHHGERAVLHPQGRAWQAEAHRERQLGHGHGPPGQDAPPSGLLRQQLGY
uniref:Uncharacterized protein n=1 Tax=Oryza punctata TaxID=4537 RepID=A0A0E0L3W8_ORYPU